MAELKKVYEAKKVEDRIYKLWEKSGFFNPDKLPKTHKTPFTILMPPPNANDPLHVGHAVFVTLEDILIRYNRMQGKKTLWLPGADHAGFETQIVYEKKLEKQGRSRFDMKREEFYKEVWNYTQKNKKTVRNQLKKLGASCDWSRDTFSLDPHIVKTVYKTFKKMADEGLIYRGERLVNYCTKHRTAFADLEIKHETRKDPFIWSGVFIKPSVKTNNLKGSWDLFFVPFPHGKVIGIMGRSHLYRSCSKVRVYFFVSNYLYCPCSKDSLYL